MLLLRPSVPKRPEQNKTEQNKDPKPGTRAESRVRAERGAKKGQLLCRDCDISEGPAVSMTRARVAGNPNHDKNTFYLLKYEDDLCQGQGHASGGPNGPPKISDATLNSGQVKKTNTQKNTRGAGR